MLICQFANVLMNIWLRQLDESKLLCLNHALLLAVFIILFIILLMSCKFPKISS